MSAPCSDGALSRRLTLIDAQPRVTVLAAFAILGIACAHRTPDGPSATPPVTSYANLMTALHAAGATVDGGAAISQPFLSGVGRIMKVNGADVQAFEYTSPAAAEADAVRINADGSGTATTLVTWVGPPHFYRTGPLLVLYVGSQGDVIRLLEAVLGQQFAGR